MKANELRVGNLVAYNGGALIQASRHLFGEKRILESAQPIPLTEEWLVKFGFKKCDDMDGSIFWILPKDDDNFNRFEIYETNQGYELPSGAICESVHILQNAYYFHTLTGEELEIK